MAIVSVGQVENLEEAIAGLFSIYDSMESACQTQVITAETKLAEAQREADNSAQLLEAAINAEMEAQQNLVQANENLASANEQLSWACSSLSACEAGGSYDEDGHYEPPDCSSEESDVVAAESIVSEAESAVASAEAKYEEKKDQRMQMEHRKELALQCLHMATQLMEETKSECTIRLSHAENYTNDGKNRLHAAQNALNAYLKTHPPVAEFHSWLHWTPSPNVPVTPEVLNNRLSLTIEQQRQYFEYLSDRDPAFRAKIADYRNQLKTANGPAERQAVQLKMRKNLSGYFSERIVEQALAPLGSKSDTQAFTTFDDGTFTKTDLIISNLKAPIILGKGEGMSAPAGGSIAIEVKSGKASYLYEQKDHMVFQSGGHQQADASVTICSRDIKDLAPKKEDVVREALKAAGSPLIAMLPPKSEIDKTCWEIVTGSYVNDGEQDEN